MFEVIRTLLIKSNIKLYVPTPLYLRNELQQWGTRHFKHQRDIHRQKKQQFLRLFLLLLFIRFVS